MFKDSLNIAICNRSKNYKTIIENQWFKSKLNRCLYSLTYHAWIFIFLFCISTADFSHKYCLLSLWNVGFSNLCSTNWFSYHSDFKIIVSYEKNTWKFSNRLYLWNVLYSDQQNFVKKILETPNERQRYM